MTSVHNPLFYNLTTLMKRNHLSVQQIQEFRGMTAAELGSVFFQKGVSTCAHLFFQLLQSFEVANNVARAVWGYKKAVEAQDDYNAKEEWANIERALHDYSPGNWQPYRGDIQFAAEYFEALFNELQNHPRENWEEVLFVWTKKLHDMLEVKGGPMPKPNVASVISGTAQHSANVYSCVVVGDVAHIERADNLHPMCDASMVGGRRALVPPTCVRCIELAGIFGEHG